MVYAYIWPYDRAVKPMNRQKKISIILAEDQDLMRQSLKALLGDYEEFTVVGEAANGKQLLDLLKTVSADVVLLDLEMPVMNGREALLVIRSKYPDVKVILLSMHNSPEVMMDLMSCGARAYVPKGSDVDALLSTIKQVDEFGYFFSEEVSKAMRNATQRDKEENTINEDAPLSDREMEVMKELCKGSTAKEIAATLFLTVRTVEFHRLNIYAKTNSHNIAELVKYAIKHGIVGTE